MPFGAKEERVEEDRQIEGDEEQRQEKKERGFYK